MITKQIYKNILLVLVLLGASSTITLGTFNKVALAQTDLKPPTPQSEKYTGELKENPIIKWIQFFVNLISVVIIAGSVIMIAVAGVQYTASRDNAQGTQKAKERIFNTIIGLVAFFFLYGFIQWLIPGGVF